MVDETDDPVARFKRLESLFQSALRMTEAERRAFLDEACADDIALRKQVEKLLCAPDDFLSNPALDLKAMPGAIQNEFKSSGDLSEDSFSSSMISKSIKQYVILAPIGKGGMGEVWLAEDTRLKRKVALKLLPAEFTNDANRVRRFEQEAHAVSRLNHPNIITLFDFGQAEDGYFITTEFVDGQTLRARLRDGARVPIGEAIEIVLQVCSALATAHEAGIIHRDIKPENLMVRRDGYVKVLDFGLARMAKPSMPAADPRAAMPSKHNTAAGSVMGTASYMSPEQARGYKVDARTDIFSLGIVLYEMLSGQLPFAGETPSDVLAEILKSEPLALPRDLSDCGNAAYAALQSIIARALAKERESRYQTLQAMANDLKRCAENLQFQARLAQLKTEPPMHVADTPIKTIVVLPFRFLGSDQTESYLGLGMTDALITKLSSARQLTVLPTSAVLKYQNTAFETDRVAREFRADAVLDGSVQKLGDKLRVTMQLIRAGTAQPLCSGEFNESVTDLFTLQDKLAARVAEELALQLSGAEQQQIAKRPTTNAEAYRHYLRGRYFWDKKTEESLKKGLSNFQQAIAIDPNYAPAYVGMADCYASLTLVSVTLPPRDAMVKAEAAAIRALEIDDTLAEAYALKGLIKLRFDRDWADAERNFKRAIELNHNCATAHQWYGGLYLTAIGRFDEAIAEMRRAQELEPTSLGVTWNTGMALYFARRYDRAIEEFQQAIELEPNFAIGFEGLGLAYERLGKYGEAVAALEKAVALSQRQPSDLAFLGEAYALAGRRADARRILEELNDLSRMRYVLPYLVAYNYAALGEPDQVFALLEKTFEERHGGIIFLNVDPAFDGLRSDPRFADLIRRIGLFP